MTVPLFSLIRTNANGEVLNAVEGQGGNVTMTVAGTDEDVFVRVVIPAGSPIRTVTLLRQDAPVEVPPVTEPITPPDQGTDTNPPPVSEPEWQQVYNVNCVPSGDSIPGGQIYSVFGISMQGFTHLGLTDPATNEPVEFQQATGRVTAVWQYVDDGSSLIIGVPDSSASALWGGMMLVK